MPQFGYSPLKVESVTVVGISFRSITGSIKQNLSTSWKKFTESSKTF